MKFNNPVDERAIWAIIKSELSLDGKESFALAKRITAQLNRTCETALQMDRVELRRELEAELEKKYAEREAMLKKREAEKSEVTKDQLVKILSEGLLDDDGKLNTQAAKLLTDLKGFSSDSHGVDVTVISYADAPDFYKTEVPEGM